MEQNQISESYINCITRGRKSGTIEARFRRTEMVREHSVIPLKTKELVFQPTYMERCTSSIRVTEVPRKVDAAWIMAALLFNKEDKINILQVTLAALPTPKNFSLARAEYSGHHSSGIRRHRNYSWQRTWSSKFMWSAKGTDVLNVAEKDTRGLTATQEKRKRM